MSERCSGKRKAQEEENTKKKGSMNAGAWIRLAWGQVSNTGNKEYLRTSHGWGSVPGSSFLMADPVSSAEDVV